MSRERLCKNCKQWHPVDNWPSACIQSRTKGRSRLSSPMLNLDTMEPVQSQLDGKIYDSKAALRRTYKEAGMVEVGNDSSVLEPKPFKPKRPDRKEIRHAVRKAANRVGLPTS